MKVTVVMVNDVPEKVLMGSEEDNKIEITALSHVLNADYKRMVYVRGYEFEVEKK